MALGRAASGPHTPLYYAAEKAVAAQRHKPPSQREYAARASSRLNATDQATAALMSSGGIVDAWTVLQSVRAVGGNLAMVCASLQMESYGGKNLWGGDPGGNALPSGYDGSEVTADVFLGIYWPNVKAGYTEQGCGPEQLTSFGFQNAAQERGGCYLPGPNTEVGSLFLDTLLRQSGSAWAAFYHYNGSGPAAEAYANEAMGHLDYWLAQKITAVAPVPPSPPPDPLVVLTPSERKLVKDYLRYVKNRRWFAYDLKQTIAKIVRARKLVFNEAVHGVLWNGIHVKPGWDVEHRHQRYDLLRKYSQ